MTLRCYKFRFSRNFLRCRALTFAPAGLSCWMFSLGLSASECQKYAVVHELIAGVDRPTIVCSGSLRARVVYLSQSNSIVIETFGGATDHHDDVTDDVTTSRHADDMTRFLLQYQGTVGHSALFSQANQPIFIRSLFIVFLHRDGSVNRNKYRDILWVSYHIDFSIYRFVSVRMYTVDV